MIRNYKHLWELPPPWPRRWSWGDTALLIVVGALIALLLAAPAHAQTAAPPLKRTWESATLTFSGPFVGEFTVVDVLPMGRAPRPELGYTEFRGRLLDVATGLLVFSCEGTITPPVNALWVPALARRASADLAPMIGHLGCADYNPAEALEVTETVLGHISGSRAGVVGIYQRPAFTDEARAALLAWSDHVAQLVDREPAKVVQLRA